MAYAAPRICARCGRLVARGNTCACRPAWEGSTHPSVSKRDTAMKRTKLRMQPLCEWPGCKLLATDVDHRTPLAEGGARYAWDNLASLCHPHHVEKTTADAQRGRRRAR